MVMMLKSSWEWTRTIESLALKIKQWAERCSIKNSSYSTVLFFLDYIAEPHCVTWFPLLSPCYVMNTDPTVPTAREQFTFTWKSLHEHTVRPAAIWNNLSIFLSSLPLSRSLSLWPGVNLSFLLPADSCAWLSGSLFMRSLHLSPAAASVTPLSSPHLVFLSSLDEKERLDATAFLSARWYLPAYTLFQQWDLLYYFPQGHTNADAHCDLQGSNLWASLSPEPCPHLQGLLILHDSFHLHKHPLVSFIPKAFLNSPWKLHIELLLW